MPALLGTGKGKENTDCNPWVSKGHCSRGQACIFKHEHKRQRIPSPSPRRKSNDTGRNGATVRSINLEGINDLWKETVWTNGGRKCGISAKWQRPRRGACKGSGEPLEWRILRKDKTCPLRKWSEDCWAGLFLRSENTVCSKTKVGRQGKQKKTRLNMTGVIWKIEDKGGTQLVGS